MSAWLDGVRVVLLDIEGTTTPISFVHDILFPYARNGLADWLREHRDQPERRDVSALLQAEHATDERKGESVPRWDRSTPDEDDRGLREYAAWLMDRDRKSPGLKRLQGLIWERGYGVGELRGEIFPDVVPALQAWRRAGLLVAIYSSGSELAQRLLFTSTGHGDLTPLLSGFFDTAVGAKRDPRSYEQIASALGVRSEELLFVSDVTDELRAAASAGCRTALSLRPGNPPQADGRDFRSIHSLAEIR